MAVIFKSVDEKDKREFDTDACEPQLNLLAHAQLIELAIGSECGGHGRCGKDRVIISPVSAKYFSQLTEIERLHLSTEELNRGVRLACQCFPEKRDQTVTVLVQKLG